MAEETMLCPKCGNKIQITAALTAQVEEALRTEIQKKADKELKAKEKEWEEKLAEEKESVAKKAKKDLEKEFKNELDELKDKLETKEKEAEKQKLKAKKLADEMDEKLKAEKETLEKKAKKDADEKYKTELSDLQIQLNEKEKKIEDQRKEELKLRAKERELEEKTKNQELDLAKQLASATSKIREEVEAKQKEAFHLKEIENIQKLESLKRTNEELTRKLEQGSQQTQGEVLEINLEETLRKTFYMDLIEPVSKGVRGADVHQTVNHPNGKASGSILWECKRTKGWSDGWIAKLKEDRLEAKADIAVIVSENLPKDIKGFGQVESVWVANYTTYIGLASVLRAGLIDVSAARDQQVGKDQKMELLHRYLTGSEFKNRVEAIVEPFRIMKEDLEREKRAVSKNWALREKQLNNVMENTAGMYGDLQGIMGRALPEINTLELPPTDETIGSKN
jgi:hypothetical protein